MEVIPLGRRCVIPLDYDSISLYTLKSTLDTAFLTIKDMTPGHTVYEGREKF